MKRFLGISTAVVLVGVACFFSVTLSQERSDRDDQRKSIHGSRHDTNEDRNRDAHPPDGEASRAKARGNGITYHGGPVILGTTNVYYIWYGNWSGNTATTILTDLAGNIGGSPYFNINTTYYNGSGTHVLNAVVFHGAAFDSYSHGSSLSDSAIQAVVSSAISSGALPKDTNGLYFVLTSSDVTASSGFCTQYCGWHTHGTIAGSDIKYSFVGNPDRCPSACEAQTKGPNSNAGADGMASIIAHELEETVTDPDLNAWYDSRGAENADKCAWTFGTTYTVNGALANMKLGARDYLIQRNWVNASGGFCALKYP
jgi:Phosphate-induced protein 1 conserved region